MFSVYDRTFTYLEYVLGLFKNILAEGCEKLSVTPRWTYVISNTGCYAYVELEGFQFGVGSGDTRFEATIIAVNDFYNKNSSFAISVTSLQYLTDACNKLQVVPKWTIIYASDGCLVYIEVQGYISAVARGANRCEAVSKAIKDFYLKNPAFSIALSTAM